jgi:hypothetical protein
MFWITVLMCRVPLLLVRSSIRLNKYIQDMGHDSAPSNFTAQWFQRKAGKFAGGYFPVLISHNENTAFLR